MMRCRHLALGVSLLALGACQTPQTKLDELPPVGNDATAGARISGSVASTDRTAKPEISLGKEGGYTAPQLPPGSTGGDVSLNFADTDIREIVRQVLGNILQVNYAIDPSVHGTATIETVKPLARTDLLPTLQLLLEQNGATLVQNGGLYRVIPTASAAAQPTVGSTSTAGSEVVALRYASARDLAKVLEPFVGEGARITADPTRNVLLVSGEPQARMALMGLIRGFDTDILAGQSFAVFPVSSGDPAKMATELQKVFQTEGDGALAGLVKVIPLERVNAVLVVSSQARYIEDARRLYALVDQARKDTERSWHVYYVQNGQASDVANLLQRAFTPGHVTAQSGGAGSTAPGLGNSSIGGQGGSGQSGFGGSNSPGGGSSTPGGGSSTPGGLGSSSSGLGSSSSGGGSQQASTFGGSGSGSDSSASTDSLSDQTPESAAKEANSIRIIPHKQNNAVLIYATLEEESTIEAMLHKIDILPLQVRIDATIAEVDLNDNLSLGTQFFFQNQGLNGVLSQATALSGSAGLANFAVPNLPGFILNKTTSDVRFALSALQAVTNVRVLSSPELLVLDNQPARLQVGDSVPYLTGTTTVITAGDNVTNSINYQETGVILEILPHVNSGGLVTLDVSQEVSDIDLAATSQTTIGSPTFSERKVRSRVSIQDGQTIGLAGLIRDNASRGNSGIPWLKDIPILGLAFSTQTDTRARTELLIMITPHVIQDQRTARALTDDLRQNLPHAALVPQQLQSLPLSGNSNPLEFISK
jgi:general secretion pathway protein D